MWVFQKILANPGFIVDIVWITNLLSQLLSKQKCDWHSRNNNICVVDLYVQSSCFSMASSYQVGQWQFYCISLGLGILKECPLFYFSWWLETISKWKKKISIPLGIDRKKRLTTLLGSLPSWAQSKSTEKQKVEKSISDLSHESFFSGECLSF